jgi:uncharacterized protein (TIGR02996 family)
MGQAGEREVTATRTDDRPLSTEDAMLAAIAAQPDDDAARLVYADFLDERGEGDDADRAEFIRLQISLVGHPVHHKAETGCPLRRRERALLAANPAWSRCECPACGGEGHRRPGPLCVVCEGTGDLFVRRGDAWTPRTLDRRRFPLLGVGCRLEELAVEETGECGRCRRLLRPQPGSHCPDCSGRGTVPSPWARAVVGAVPMLRALVISDRAPEDTGSREWAFVREEPARPALRAYYLPALIFDQLKGWHRESEGFGIRYWHDRAAALDALACAAARFARGVGS